VCFSIFVILAQLLVVWVILFYISKASIYVPYVMFLYRSRLQANVVNSNYFMKKHSHGQTLLSHHLSIALSVSISILIYIFISILTFTFTLIFTFNLSANLIYFATYLSNDLLFPQT